MRGCISCAVRHMCTCACIVCAVVLSCCCFVPCLARVRFLTAHHDSKHHATLGLSTAHHVVRTSRRHTCRNNVRRLGRLTAASATDFTPPALQAASRSLLPSCRMLREASPSRAARAGRGIRSSHADALSIIRMAQACAQSQRTLMQHTHPPPLSPSLTSSQALDAVTSGSGSTFGRDRRRGCCLALPETE